MKTRCIARVTLLGTCPSRLLGGGLGLLPDSLLLLLLPQLLLQPLEILPLVGDEYRLGLLLPVPVCLTPLLLLREDL